ncbi:MAG: NHLP bacteriocin export ABC transporter permease/ATPase subunit [Parachlamydiaceae bacterium]|nr:NHLP bacteriocin export ABC transporter permease/ATPase subunit [Parachlamydiaceae bacterium]
MPKISPPSELMQLLLKEGEELVISVNQRIILHDVKKLLWLEEGELDITVLFPQSLNVEKFSSYAIISGEDLSGSFIFLHNFQINQCLFPFPLINNCLVMGLPNSQVKLRALPIERIQTYILNHPSAKQELLHHMGRWINTLPSIFDQYRIHHFSHHLQMNVPTMLMQNQTIAVPRFRYQDEHEAITWITITQGSVNILGLEEIRLTASEEIFPLSPNEWLQSASNQTEINVFTNEYNSENYQKFWQGLFNFQRIVMQVAANEMATQNLKAHKTETVRTEKEQEFLDTVLREMGTVLSEEKAPPILPSTKPLIRACQMIGKTIQQTFVEPATGKAKNYAEQVYKISVASGVYCRNVLLTKYWWKQDHGPLLGFVNGKKEKPAALLTYIPGQYYLLDPTEGVSKKIDAPEADTLSPKAYMFYRSFPSKAILTGKEIFNFCLQGRIKDYWTVLLIGLFTIIISLFLPIANQLLFDEVIPYLDEVTYAHILIGLGIMYLSMALFSVTSAYAILRAESYLSHDVEVALWARMFSLPTQFFRRFTLGNLIQRITSIQEMRKIISGKVINIMINGGFSILFLAVMLYYSPILTLVGVIIMAIGLIVSLIGFYFSQSLELSYQELKGQINGKVIQMIFGLSKIRTNGVENRIFASWAKDTIQSQRLRLRIGSINNIVQVTNLTLDLLKYLIIFLVIIILMQAPSPGGQVFAITIGSFLAFNAAFLNVSSSISEFSITLMDMISIYPLWKRSKVIIQEHPETSLEKIKPDVFKGEVRIEHLSFRYDQQGALVNNDISLYADPGEFIAIVGPSGCGKSTIVRLLLGFETPEQGAIYFDGKDLATLDLRAVRRQMGTILQNSMIIDGTIFDNITAGDIASQEEVIWAAQLAGLTNDLKELPMGLNTLLTTGGMTLSGGQRQRLLVARAFLTKAPLMIWDEATNAFDNMSQSIVMQNLEKLDVTRIVIAHRLSTIKHADRIYVMDNGKIVDVGTFKDLSSRSGKFSELLALQMV